MLDVVEKNIKISHTLKKKIAFNSSFLFTEIPIISNPFIKKLFNHSSSFQPLELFKLK